MKRNLLLLLALVGGVLGFTLWGQEAPPLHDLTGPVPVEHKAFPPVPEFSFAPWGTDEIRQVSSLRGQAVLIHFWASWCAPCRVEFPTLMQLAAQRDKTLTVLAVSVDADAAEMHQFLADFQQFPANVIIVADPQRRIAQDVFQTFQFPETVMVGADQTLRDKLVGAADDWTSAEMRARMDGLMTP